MKKRTAFETSLIRRVARKGDYLRYAAYEMGLEALRKKRVERLSMSLSLSLLLNFQPMLTGHNISHALLE